MVVPIDGVGTGGNEFPCDQPGVLSSHGVELFNLEAVGLVSTEESSIVPLVMPHNGSFNEHVLHTVVGDHDVGLLIVAPPFTVPEVAVTVSAPVIVAGIPELLPSSGALASSVANFEIRSEVSDVSGSAVAWYGSDVVTSSSSTATTTSGGSSPVVGANDSLRRRFSSVGRSNNEENNQQFHPMRKED